MVVVIRGDRRLRYEARSLSRSQGQTEIAQAPVDAQPNRRFHATMYLLINFGDIKDKQAMTSCETA